MARRKVVERCGCGWQAGVRSMAEGLEQRVMLAAAQVELLDAKPVVFVGNQGQWSDSSVYYAYNSGSASIAFEDSWLRFRLTQSSPVSSPSLSLSLPAGGLADPISAPAPDVQSTSLSMQFVGANRVTPQGEQKADGVYNYFVGDQANWRSGVSGYQTVSYDDLLSVR